ncbi:Sequence-specific DNA binding transcription factor [Quillaja saponaria]|uniref:Sequence-specific DNA binding transcription factor n=1 Tax=Quillaja saponaria TaxID=32244 RepID=A0AAD7PYE2_QUISA|nr:Sequence-specific DNA binding transcription factor [Quillaja saponaria]
MEPNGLGGGMFSGMLGLETPLHQQQNAPNSQNPHHLHHSQIVAYAHHDTEHHPQPQQQSIKHGYPYVTKPKEQITLSDDDEPSLAADDSTGTGDAKRKTSPWQRMKWTDTMVKLLIMAVFYIGDEGGMEGTDPTGKKKSTGLLQKKGKWKSVSRAMMEKGFYVSPQQCEDKFNDLNKRYKRVNDILGKGTACRVVENQSLLDTMDLSPKMKEEVRKLLNSKHLFFREMCAYHNSCGHGTGGAPNSHQSPETAAEPVTTQPQQQQQQQQQPQQQRCFHSSENGQMMTNLGRAEGLKLGRGGSEEEEDDDDEEEDDESEDDSDEDEEDITEGGSRGRGGHGHEDEDENDEGPLRKRPRKAASSTSAQLMNQLNCEITSVFQDGAKSPWEKKHWMKTKLIQLEEQQVSYQCQAFELEKQRLKWVKYSSKKERDMEKSKLENEKSRLENERMVLLIRQKENELLKLFHQQQQQYSSNKRGDPPSITG